MTCAKVIVLGYYDKHNIGDDAFKTVFESILNPNLYELHFINPVVQLHQNPEWSLPDNTKCVIVGGGDLINDHFMPPIRKLLIGFTGSRLAIGVGISYPDTAAYLRCFDYVIVRSQVDYEMAKNYVAEGFLECMPDLTYFLDRKNLLKPKVAPLLTNTNNEEHPNKIIRIALCVAEPCLATAHQHGKKILEDLSHVFTWLNTQLRENGFHPEFTFIPFNTNAEHEEECDWVAIQRLQALLDGKIETKVLATEIAQDTLKVFDYFTNEVDFVLGMRYHSILFSMVTRTPFVALYSTPKIRNLLGYVGIQGTASDHAMEYFKEESHIPLGFDKQKLLGNINTVMAETPRKTRFFASNQVAYAAKIRKLIKTSAQFATIEPGIGYEFKFLDDHHLNRLTMGTMKEYLLPIDGVHDGQFILKEILPQHVVAGRVAKDLCQIMLTRFHLGLFTIESMETMTTSYLQSVDESAYIVYLHGFESKVFTEPIRPQLNWIMQHYYRGLSPVLLKQWPLDNNKTVDPMETTKDDDE